MALKEVKETTPEVKKFTKEELEQLTTLQKKTQQSTFQFGQLYLSKLRLEEQETTLKNHVISLEKEEAELAEALSTKYGKGSINIDTGEFTPVKE